MSKAECEAGGLWAEEPLMADLSRRRGGVLPDFIGGSQCHKCVTNTFTCVPSGLTQTLNGRFRYPYYGDKGIQTSGCRTSDPRPSMCWACVSPERAVSRDIDVYHQSSYLLEMPRVQEHRGLFIRHCFKVIDSCLAECGFLWNVFGSEGAERGSELLWDAAP